MADPEIKSGHKFTYAEYCTWPEDERWELIDGAAYDMSPAPSLRHQSISIMLASRLFNFLEGKSCNVFPAPFDVIIPSSRQDLGNSSTVVQPDISVICDKMKLVDQGCLGAPDLIVEILSPSTGKKDMDEKFHLYERHGVKEYWIVDPAMNYIRIYKRLENGLYDSGVLIDSADVSLKVKVAESMILDGFKIDIEELFADEK